MILKDTTLTRWLVYAALADWLVARTLTRLGIFMPKSPVLISLYQSLTLFGQAAASFGGLLVLAILLVWVHREARKGTHTTGIVLIGTLSFLSILFLFLQPSILIAASYHLLLISALAYTCWRGLRSVIDTGAKLAMLASALALQAGAAGHLVQGLGLHGTGLLLFNTGEVLVLLSILSIWFAFGRPASRWIWFVGFLPALAFSVFRVLDPATSGILAIWSTGMTLYLPWPSYSLAVWLAVVTVLAYRKKGDPYAANGILLLASGGFAAQMTSHAFYGLAGLGLLVRGAGSGETALPEAGDQGIEEGQRMINHPVASALHTND